MIDSGFPGFLKGFIPNQNPATVYPMTSPGVFGTGVIFKVARKKPPQIDIQQFLLALNLSAETVQWSLWADSAAVAGTVPRVGDVIYGVDGERWVIKLVRLTVLGNLYQCGCVKEVTAS